jgi:hypothetical protein
MENTATRHGVMASSIFHMAMLSASRKTSNKFYPKMLEGEDESDDEAFNELLNLDPFSKTKTNAAKKKSNTKIAPEMTEEPPPPSLTTEEIKAQGTCTSQVCIIVILLLTSTILYYHSTL